MASGTLDYTSYRFMMQNGYQFENDSLLPPGELADGTPAKIYGKPLLEVTATDREGMK
jgi:hypothetical protein